MREIQLTRGFVTQVDDEDYEWLNRWKWMAQKGTKTFYATRRKKRIWMHRVILNTPENKQTDHIDGNGLNNSRSNLRVCSCSENFMNRMPYLNRSSLYKGVDWHKATQKWRVRIKINRKERYLGVFNSEIEAAKTYDGAAIKLFGEFARINTYA